MVAIRACARASSLLASEREYALPGSCQLHARAARTMMRATHGHRGSERTRGGIAYYPKLLVATPFTPATGVRFLAHPDYDRAAVIRALGSAVQEICARQQFSSAHVNFC